MPQACQSTWNAPHQSKKKTHTHPPHPLEAPRRPIALPTCCVCAPFSLFTAAIAVRKVTLKYPLTSKKSNRRTCTCICSEVCICTAHWCPPKSCITVPKKTWTACVRPFTQSVCVCSAPGPRRSASYVLELAAGRCLHPSGFSPLEVKASFPPPLYACTARSAQPWTFCLLCTWPMPAFWGVGFVWLPPLGAQRPLLICLVGLILLA